MISEMWVLPKHSEAKVPAMCIPSLKTPFVQ